MFSLGRWKQPFQCVLLGIIVSKENGKLMTDVLFGEVPVVQ